MIEAWTATWLRFDEVRNWGAASETSPPSTNMIARRLSSRWRATADSHVPWATGSVLGTAGAGSGMGSRVAAAARRGLGADAARGREHDSFRCRPVARDLGCQPAFVEDDDPVGHRQDLGQVARDYDDSDPCSRQLADDPMDLDLGADVDPPGRLVEN